MKGGENEGQKINKDREECEYKDVLDDCVYQILGLYHFLNGHT